MKYNWKNIVKDVRKSLMLSQEEMAKKLGVAFCTVNRYENSHYEPTPKVQRKLRTMASRTDVDIKKYLE